MPSNKLNLCLALRNGFRFVPATWKGSEWNSSKWEGEMKLHKRLKTQIVPILGALLLSVAAFGQQRSASVPSHGSASAYDVRRESVLQAVVLEYTAVSSAAPFGAHVLLQTSSGTVDAHLGNSKLFEANHLSLSAGDSVRVVGENLPFNHGTIFAVRTLQKGSQSVTLRSKNGMPLVNTTVPNKTGNAVAQPVGVR
jgi:hypothetical protein